jgi:phage shock protein E
MKHLVKTVLFFLITGCVSAQNKSSVNTTEFEKAIQAKDAQVVDVRRPEEYKEGHIKGAVLANWQDQGQFEEKIKGLDKNKPVYLYCLAGVRSSKAADALVKKGFTKVVHLDGGIEAWKAAGKPLE